MNLLSTLMEDLETEDVKLYLLARKKSIKKKKTIITYNAFNINLSDQLCQNLLTSFSTQLNTILSHVNFDKIPYNPINNPDKGIIETIDLNNLNFFDNIQNIFNNHPDDYEAGALPQGYVPWAYIVVLDVEEEIHNQEIDSQLIIFQRITDKKLINENNDNLARVKKIISGQNQEFIELMGDILVLDDRIDCICHFYHDEDTIELPNGEIIDLNQNKLMYINNKYPFELIFGFEDMFKTEIQRNIEVLQLEIEMDPDRENLIDLDKLYGLCERDSRKLKKLYAIFEYDLFNRLNQNNIDSIRAIGINIKQDDDGLLEVTKENIKPVLDIIFDNYLESLLLEQIYLTGDYKQII